MSLRNSGSTSPARTRDAISPHVADEKSERKTKENSTSSQNDAERKRAVDRVQQIVADEQPFIYLVYPNVLIAVSPHLQGVEPAVLEPNLVWNVENLRLQGAR